MAADAGLGSDVALVLAALTAAMVGKGGYYRTVSDVCAVLLVAAAAVLFARHGFAALRLGGVALAGFAVMAASTAVTGVLDGHVRAALGPVGLIVGLAIIVAVVAASSIAVRRQLTDLTLVLGGLLAATAWIGVALHVEPLGHPDGGLWRAATTVTYANAAAAILGPLALWALARATTQEGWPTRALAVLLLAGLGATLSRAGLASFVVGLLVVAALLGFGVVWRAIAMILLGGLVAVVALAPGMPATSGAKPVWALLGLAVGLALGAARRPAARDGDGTSERGHRWLEIECGAVLVATAVGVALLAFSGHSRVWSGRFGLASPDRASLVSVALHMWRGHLLSGVGPGRAVFIWTTAQHHLVVDRYVHNEYLQVAVEQGLIGLVGLGALIAAIGATAFAGARRRFGHGPNADLLSMRAGAVGGLACLALHSGFDFLWHVPAVPMLAAIAIGLTACRPEIETDPSQQTKELS